MNASPAIKLEWFYFALEQTGIVITHLKLIIVIIECNSHYIQMDKRKQAVIFISIIYLAVEVKSFYWVGILDINANANFFQGEKIVIF